MTRKKEAKNPEYIKGIIGSVINKIEKRGPGKKEKVFKAWQKVAGQAAASHSRPASIKRKILTIEVDSSTWLYNFSLKKKGMVKDIQKELGEEVRDIRFRMGDIS